MGIEIIRWFQSFGTSTAVHTIMEVLTALGGLWCMSLFVVAGIISNKDKGIKIASMVIASLIINILLKHLIQLERPFHVYPDVFLINESGFSFPSGHAQISATFFWLLAWFEKRNVVFWLLPILIGISRCYLGVHYPTDVLAGWAIGAFFAWGYFKV